MDLAEGQGEDWWSIGSGGVPAAASGRVQTLSFVLRCLQLIGRCMFAEEASILSR